MLACCIRGQTSWQTGFTYLTLILEVNDAIGSQAILWQAGWRKEELASSQPKIQTLKPSRTEFDLMHVRKVVAGNPNTPKQVLMRLAEDRIPQIRLSVAENLKSPVEVLNRLSTDEHPDVRIAVAENVNTPPETLSYLASDENVDVRYGVAENPHMPEQILLKLSQDDNPYIRCRALKTLQMLAPEAQTRLRVLLQEASQAMGKNGRLL